MDVLKDNFWYVPNVLSKEELKFLNFYTQMRHTYNFSNFDDKQTKLGETAFYADPAMETLLHFKTKIFEEVIKKELHPTYSFWRYYIKYSVLDSHKDRDSCELTATINLGGCGTEWPLHVEDKKIIIKPGDAALYHGAKLKHWREEFQGDGQAQLFLHWVYKDGPYTEHKFDRRVSLGAPLIKN
tara:strand:+ start:2107 stop:2658 length:552 start_codon:yes stop_codon:yes gene_type:complete